MSRWCGPQGKGARRQLREVPMYQAYNRQVRYRQAHPEASDPIRMLTSTAQEHLTRGHIDIATWGMK
jgi:hypothetical protein